MACSLCVGSGREVCPLRGGHFPNHFLTKRYSELIVVPATPLFRTGLEVYNDRLEDVDGE